MSDLSNTPSSRAFWLSALGIIGCFLIFGVVLFVAGIPNRPVDQTAVFSPAEMREIEALPPAERETRLRELRLERGLLTVEDRQERLSELRIKEDHALASYQWIDKEKGIVRLPIDRAMEIVVRDAQAQK